MAAVQQQAGLDANQIKASLDKSKDMFAWYIYVMEPVKVYCFGLADRMGAEMYMSRVRVAVMFYMNVFAAVVALIVLVGLSSWDGFVGCAGTIALGVAVSVYFWVNIVYEHSVDELPYLQGHICAVAKHVAHLEGLLQQLRQASLQATPDYEAATALCTDFKGLLAKLRLRENRMCNLFNGYSVRV